MCFRPSAIVSPNAQSTEKLTNDNINNPNVPPSPYSVIDTTIPGEQKPDAATVIGKIF